MMVKNNKFMHCCSCFTCDNVYKVLMWQKIGAISSQANYFKCYHYVIDHAGLNNHFNFQIYALNIGYDIINVIG